MVACLQCDKKTTLNKHTHIMLLRLTKDLYNSLAIEMSYFLSPKIEDTSYPVATEILTRNHFNIPLMGGCRNSLALKPPVKLLMSRETLAIC